MKFSKPSLPISEQVLLLKRRGMHISDTAKAEHYLRHISYYRLRAYWLPFEAPAATVGDHCFRPGTKFDDALALYVFDRHLRLLVMDAVERVEVSLRGNWAHHLAQKYGPHGYLEPSIYARSDHYAKAFATLLDEIARSRDTFITHYENKYGDPAQPPIWMTAEVISLGQLSKWIGNLKFRPDRQEIARSYVLDEKVLISIAHHLTYVRNICAHHGRLWNKQFTVTMTIPNSPSFLRNSMNPTAPRRVYNTLTMLGYLLSIIAPGTTWRTEIINLIDSRPIASMVSMGFPTGWSSLPAWQ